LLAHVPELLPQLSPARSAFPVGLGTSVGDDIEPQMNSAKLSQSEIRRKRKTGKIALPRSSGDADILNFRAVVFGRLHINKQRSVGQPPRMSGAATLRNADFFNWLYDASLCSTPGLFPNWELPTAKCSAVTDLSVEIADTVAEVTGQ